MEDPAAVDGGHNNDRVHRNLPGPLWEAQGRADVSSTTSGAGAELVSGW
jgi:hypothetical protein